MFVCSTSGCDSGSICLRVLADPAVVPPVSRWLTDWVSFCFVLWVLSLLSTLPARALITFERADLLQHLTAHHTQCLRSSGRYTCCSDCSDTQFSDLCASVQIRRRVFAVCAAAKFAVHRPFNFTMMTVAANTPHSVFLVTLQEKPTL